MGKGGDGQKNGGDTTDLIIKSVAATAGAFMGGPAGAKMGWDMGGQASDMLTGKGDGSSDSWSSKLNKVGDTASGVYGMTQGGAGVSEMGSGESNQLTKILGQGGTGGGPSLEMPSTAPGLKTSFLSPEELERQNGLNGIGKSFGSMAGDSGGGEADMAKRLLSFFDSMQGGGQQQPQAMAPVNVNFPRMERPQPVPGQTYNVQSPQLMPMGKPVYNMMR